MKLQDIKSYLLCNLMLIALSCAYCALGGLLSMLISFLIAALFGMVFYRYHYGLSVLSFLATVLVFILFYSPIQAISVLVPLLLLGIAFSLSSRYKLSFYPLLLLCTFLFAADFLLGLYMLQAKTEGALTLNSIILENGRAIEGAYISMYGAENAHEISKLISSVIDICLMLAPAMLLIMCAVSAYLSILFYKSLLKKAGEDMSYLKLFYLMQAERPLAVFYLVMLILLTVVPQGMFASALSNVFLITSFMFIILGASVFDFKMVQKGSKKITRVLILLAIFSFSFVMYIPLLFFLIYGLSDSFFDYRKLRKEEE